MISYAVDQGSVGPHTDSYDVFLIQLKGKRLWQISDGTYSDDDLLADSEVKVLTNFKKHHEWLLEPGDMLYLPPNVAHWGIAQGDCLTASVGFLAPTASELFSAWSESKMQSSMGKIHYSDPDLDYRDSPSEITAADINKVEKIISNLIKENPVLTQKWFGEMISQSKAHLEIIPNSDAIVNLEQHPEAGLRYTRHPFLRMFYTVTQENQLLLFANGESFELDSSEKDFADYLCENTGYDVDELKQWMDNNKNKACFISLLSLGFIEFEEK